MQIVDAGNVQSRFSNGLPRAIDLVCAHCRREATLEVRTWHEHGRQVAAGEANCPRCGHPALFVLISDGPGHEGTLYTHPPSSARAPMPGADQLHLLSGPLGRSYDSALKLYNRGEWGAAALTLRHVLEGVAGRLVGEDKRELSLVRQLAALPDEVDLARPLRDVAALLAPGGPFGRAFEDEALFDGATAGQLLELTELLIAYLMVLPSSLESLRERIDSAPVPLRRPAAASGGLSAAGAQSS